MAFFYLSLSALIVGSFVSFVSYRLGTGQNMALAYSKCTNCNYRLKCFNLIPLFSWLVQGGKCSTCKVKISLRYPAIELLFVLLFNLIYYANGFELDYNLLFLLAIATIMAVMSIIDVEYYFVPLSMQIILLLFVVAYLFFLIDDPREALYRAFSGFIYMSFSLALYYGFLIFAKKEAIGTDDIKLFYTIGLLIGLGNFIEFTFYSGAIGVIFGALWTKIKNDDTFPFAPTILTSAFLCFIMEGRFELIDIMTTVLANKIAVAF